MSMPSRSGTGSGPLVAGLITVVVVAVTAIILAAAGITPQRAWDSFFPPEPVTTQGTAIKALYDSIFYIAATIFFVVEGLIIWTVIRYRRKAGDDILPPQTHGNIFVEVIWTVIPLMIVLVLFVLSWQTLNTVQAQSPSTVEIRAAAARFQWTFDYFDVDGNVAFTQIIPQGEGEGMTVPVGEPVSVTLYSGDVLHAFYVPRFLFKKDVVPGRDNKFEFTADEPGTYRGQCAELCGAFHGSMIFEVHVVSRADYDAWFTAHAAAAAATPTQPPASAEPTPAVSGPAPSGEATPAPTQGTADTTITVEAAGIQWATGDLEAPADKPFNILFKNDDAGTPHNVEIKDADGKSVFKGEIFSGAAEKTYLVNPLAAGTYTYACMVHPNMTATLTVK